MATETHEMFENVYGNEVLSHMPVPEWFEVFWEGLETLKITQGVGSFQLLNIQKHLQNFVNWWLEAVEWS